MYGREKSGPGQQSERLLRADSTAKSFSGYFELSSLQGSSGAWMGPDIHGCGLSLSLFSALPASPPTKLLPCSSITISQKTERRGDPPTPQVPPPRPVLLRWLLRCPDARAAGLGETRWEAADQGKLWESSSPTNQHSTHSRCPWSAQPRSV